MSDVLKFQGTPLSRREVLIAREAFEDGAVCWGGISRTRVTLALQDVQRDAANKFPLPEGVRMARIEPTAEVVATYEMGEPVTFEINISETHLRWRVKGELRWTKLPWNAVFGWLEATMEHDANWRSVFGKRSR